MPGRRFFLLRNWRVGRSDAPFAGEAAGEQAADLLQVLCLPQRPHQLGDGGLGGHVPALDHPLGQGLLPRLVEGEIAALDRKSVV